VLVPALLSLPIVTTGHPYYVPAGSNV